MGQMEAHKIERWSKHYWSRKIIFTIEFYRQAWWRQEWKRGSRAFWGCTSTMSHWSKSKICPEFDGCIPKILSDCVYRRRIKLFFTRNNKSQAWVVLPLYIDWSFFLPERVMELWWTMWWGSLKSWQKRWIHITTNQKVNLSISHQLEEVELEPN